VPFYSENITESHLKKTERGYGRAWDVVFDYMLANNGIKKLLEIGVGGGESHLAWLNLFKDAQIYGLEVAWPILPESMFSWKEMQKDHHDDDIVVRQIVNAIQGWHKFTNISFDDRLRLHIMYNVNAKREDVMQSMLKAHGNFDVVINDSKHRITTAQLMSFWRKLVGTNGVYFQEEFCSTMNDHFKTKRYHDFIANNPDDKSYWRVFDFREISTEQPGSSVLGMYTQNQGILNAVDESLDKFIIK
tara:strand:+ start:498 stop:1235 length:738 start_codon:yes stop_codon:yes gene_type:complete